MALDLSVQIYDFSMDAIKEQEEKVKRTGEVDYLSCGEIAQLWNKENQEVQITAADVYSCLREWEEIRDKFA